MDNYKADPKGSVNHDDTMRRNLLTALLKDLSVFHPELSEEVIGKILGFSEKSPAVFKQLFNEGVKCGAASYQSSYLGVRLNPALAIQIGALFAKYPNLNERDENTTRLAALTTLVNSELEVKKFEESSLDKLAKTRIFYLVRAELRSLLKDFDPGEVISDLRFGPGVTSTPHIKMLSQKNAWIIRNNGVVLPEFLYEYFHNRGLLKVLSSRASSLARSFEHLTERNFTAPSVFFNSSKVDENITTVPKDALTDRPISTFPVGVTLISVAANSALGRVINSSDARVEFTYQGKCSGLLDDYVREGGNYKRTATIDLKDASGHVSWRLLNLLIDNSDVLELLRALRGEFAHFTVKVEALKAPSQNIIERAIPVDAAGSRTFSSLLGVNETSVVNEEIDKWSNIVARTPWLKTIVDDGTVPIFYSVTSTDKWDIAEIDVLRYSHAGMGSGVTFPIMAALIAAILRASKVSDFRVFGDDIVLTNVSSEDVSRVITNLELFGLVVNRQKSCFGHNPIREAVGSWWFDSPTNLERLPALEVHAYSYCLGKIPIENVDECVYSNPTIARFTPLYVRKDLSALFNLVVKDVTDEKTGKVKKVPVKCQDLRILHYAVKLHNYARSIGMMHLAELLARVLARNSAVPIARVAVSSGLFGLEVPDEELWDWYSPVFSKGVLVSLRQRLSRAVGSFQNGSHSVIGHLEINANRDIQVLYVKIKGIQVVGFDKPTPGSFIDSDLLPLVRSFSQDPFFESLGILGNDCSDVEFREWVRRSNSILKTAVDLENSDRPEKDDDIFHQVTTRMEIPLSVIIAWENQVSAT